MVNAACGASLSRTESDDVLDGIQKKIELAMNNCFVQNTAAPLDSLFTKLNKLEEEFTMKLADINTSVQTAKENVEILD